MTPYRISRRLINEIDMRYRLMEDHKVMALCRDLYVLYTTKRLSPTVKTAIEHTFHRFHLSCMLRQINREVENYGWDTKVDTRNLIEAYYCSYRQGKLDTQDFELPWYLEQSLYTTACGEVKQ